MAEPVPLPIFDPAEFAPRILTLVIASAVLLGGLVVAARAAGGAASPKAPDRGRNAPSALFRAPPAVDLDGVLRERPTFTWVAFAELLASAAERAISDRADLRDFSAGAVESVRALQAPDQVGTLVGLRVWRLSASPEGVHGTVDAHSRIGGPGGAVLVRDRMRVSLRGLTLAVLSWCREDRTPEGSRIDLEPEQPEPGGPQPEPQAREALTAFARALGARDLTSVRVDRDAAGPVAFLRCATDEGDEVWTAVLQGSRWDRVTRAPAGPLPGGD